MKHLIHFPFLLLQKEQMPLHAVKFQLVRSLRLDGGLEGDAVLSLALERDTKFEELEYIYLPKTSENAATKWVMSKAVGDSIYQIVIYKASNPPLYDLFGITEIMFKSKSAFEEYRLKIKAETLEVANKYNVG